MVNPRCSLIETDRSEVNLVFYFNYYNVDDETIGLLGIYKGDPWPNPQTFHNRNYNPNINKNCYKSELGSGLRVIDLSVLCEVPS